MLTCLYICILCFFWLKCKNKYNAWKENRKMPRLTQNAAIIDKHVQTIKYEIKGKKIWRDTLSYHITFQLPNEETAELCLPYQIYRFLFKGDIGKLTFQGTKFLAFERTKIERLT